MATRYLMSGILLFGLFCHASLVFAQTTASRNSAADTSLPDADRDYFLREDTDGIIEVVQKLNWPAVEHVRFYEVILQKQNQNGEYEAYGTWKTEDTELELTLKSGEYRYQLVLYNLLGKPAFTTDFETFNVKKAYLPVLTEISPEIFYIDDYYDNTFTVRGLNLRPESSYTIEKAGLRIVGTGESVSQNGRSAVVRFDPERFDTGQWILRVENPGGFTSEISLDVRFAKWYDLTVSGAYKPLFVVHDQTIKTYFDTDTSFLGTAAQVSFLPLKRRFGYFGAALSFSYHWLGNTLVDYKLKTNIFQGYALFLYRLPFMKKRFMFGLHAGAGVLAIESMQFSFSPDLHSAPFSAFYISATAGVSLQFFVYKRLYIEAGTDFAVTFMPDMSLMTLMPSLSVGWSF